MADDARNFAENILDLIRDQNLRHSYERAAAALARKYDWSNITAQFEGALLRAVAGNRTDNAVAGD